MFRRSALTVLMAAFVVPAVCEAQQPTAAEKGSGMAEVTAKSLKWTAANIPGFIPGMEMAVVSGDPSKDEPYTMRLRFPDGYAFPAHYHPKAENLTVLTGTFQLAMGDKTNAAALKTYTPGDYLFLPATMAHFGRVQGETVVQLHGVGPFDLKVVEQIPGAAK
jgi:quercetin dioxygenase-like cupin family protein